MIAALWFSIDRRLRSLAHWGHDVVGWPFRWFLERTAAGHVIRRTTHPNFWSFLRIPMALIVGLCLAVGATGIAIGVYLLAVLTDRFDGEFARLDKKTSDLGELLDTVADSLLQAALLLGLAHRYPLLWSHHAWARWPYILVTLEVIKLIGGPMLAHLPAFRRCYRARRPNMSGKYKMVATSISVLFIMAHWTTSAQQMAALATAFSAYSLGRHLFDANDERKNLPTLVAPRVAQL